MPQMGVSVAEGTIVAWRVEVGDRIEADATIAEISTDKIDTEVPAPVSGVVAEILLPVEETVDGGRVLARIATPDSGGGGGGARAARRNPTPLPVPIPIPIPIAGERAPAVLACGPADRGRAWHRSLAGVG